MPNLEPEKLPSGILIAKCVSEDDTFLIINNEFMSHFIVASRSDINRMHGIAFPEKRRSGVCYNASPEDIINSPE